MARLSRPAGVKFVVIAGDPSQPGLYTIRAKFAPHTMSQPHWHPEARSVTVLKGTWWAGIGPKFDPKTTTPVPMGGFSVHTSKAIHYDGAKDEETVVQAQRAAHPRTPRVSTRVPWPRTLARLAPISNLRCRQPRLQSPSFQTLRRLGTTLSAAPKVRCHHLPGKSDRR